MAVGEREIRVSEPLTEVAEARMNGHADPLQDKGWVLANEAALLEAIVEQQAAVIWTPFTVPRYQIQTPDGPRPMEFRIRGLSQSEFDSCEKKASLPTGRRLAGGAQEMKRNEARYAHLLVIAATHPDDAERLWKNAALRERLRVADMADVVGKVLQPGEVARVGTEIAGLSGYIPSDSELAKSPD